MPDFSKFSWSTCLILSTVCLSAPCLCVCPGSNRHTHLQVMSEREERRESTQQRDLVAMLNSPSLTLLLAAQRLRARNIANTESKNKVRNTGRGQNLWHYTHPHTTPLCFKWWLRGITSVWVIHCFLRKSCHCAFNISISFRDKTTFLAYLD